MSFASDGARDRFTKAKHLHIQKRKQFEEELRNIPNKQSRDAKNLREEISAYTHNGVIHVIGHRVKSKIYSALDLHHVRVNELPLDALGLPEHLKNISPYTHISA